MESKADSIMSPSSPPCENIINPPASTLLPAPVTPPKQRSKHCVRIQFNLLEAEQVCDLGASRKKRACVRSNVKSGRAFNISFLEEIILGWEGEDLFKFGTTIIPFTADDIALILGVPSVWRDVPISGPVQKSILHSQFSNTQKFDREGIKKLIHGIIKSNETDDVANTVRLWILLLLSTFLAPRTNFTCPPQMLHCLDDLNRVKDFAWADGFQKLILNKMNDAHEAAMNKICGVKTLAKRNYKSDLEGKRFIYGCSAALCILLSLIPHSEEEWLLSGLESSTKVVEEGEQEEEEER
ncbi:hypothetical protein Taro_044329 [Colocasia esculenta]|uniref:Aminotransferase-like plant mobile domain-containing protein n=1 Tax=Colocasia esculenta TaxID=4460 RepID=A0A843X0K8_COLES|nr:hypothetical protein [Colocasia esculenta]